MNDAVPVMELQQLSIGYAAGGDKKPLFSNISAQISQGMLIGLFGRNGIGKSTLLRTMAGLQPSTGGTIMLSGRQLCKHKLSEIAKHIALVPSKPQHISGLSVTDMVGTGRYRFTNWLGVEREHDTEAIHKALKVTALTHLATRDSATLSDGELQRASIARSLVQDTPLVILDEPTAFLDMGNKYKTVSLLKELTQTTGKGVLFSSHDLTLALQVCDILWIMTDQGFYAQPPDQLIQNGILDRLFYSHGLIFDRNILNYTFNTTQHE